MSQFDTVMAQTGLPVMRRMFGDDAVYTPPVIPPEDAVPVATWAVLRKESVMVGQYGDRVESRMTARLPIADVPNPVIGASLTVGATHYRIDQVRAITQLWVSVVLREIEG